MTTDNSVLEQELRELFSTIPAPPAPGSWAGAPPPMRRARRAAPRIALAAALAVAITAVFVLVRRDSAVTPLTAYGVGGAGGLSCSLPIAALSADRTTGFIDLDHGHATFRPAPTGGTTYVPALGRWVDVLPQMVAPDGRSYVKQQFSGGRTSVRIADAGGDREVLETRAPINVFAFSPQGILLIDMTPPPGGPDGTLRLQVLDPATGVVQPWPFPPPQMGSVREAGGGSAAGYRRQDNAIWLTAYSPASSSALVRRYDLATGATTEWFDGRTDGPGHVEVVGTDGSGRPIVQLANTDLFHTNPAQRAGIAVRTILLTAPHALSVLNEGRVGSAGVAGNLSPLSVNDGDRVWLASDDGTIWMYRAASGLQEMARVVKTSTRGAPGVVISGPCR